MSGSSFRLVVDVQVLNNSIGQFRGVLSRLQQFMQAVNTIMNVISTVAWTSPASAVLLQKYRLLFRQIEESVRIAQEYIRDLEETRDRFLQIESQVSNRMETLRTDVFGV